ncbi:MAG: restriction endonuclease subunit S [Paenibacillus dendritiformis]|uniref:restriction endonuclease subunit S n=1 Tax=Paenibacillus dendritiformis TaxID=130049 RepID=UPI001FF0CF48|nr:restriction endonuclease subunit S [Paenibacillus dendritiformis]MDU5145171.1 restriction endonuclease subunit S [Paenibacillus dendritiformis]
MIEQFWNICLLHDIYTRDQLLREALRVNMTKQSLEQHAAPVQLETEPEKLFQWMKEHVEVQQLGHFPGDRDLFYKLYHAGKQIDMLEYALQTLQHDRITGNVIVPTSIMTMFLDQCERNQYKSILVAEAEKYIRGIWETQCYKKTTYQITLLTESYILAQVFRTYFAPYPNVSVIQGTIYQPLPLEDKYDAILTLPHFGMKIDEQETSMMIRDSEGVAVHHLLPLLQDHGMLSVTLPARMMFQAGEYANWRKQLHQAAPVHAIALLPDGLLRPYTSVRMYQLMLGTRTSEEVKLVRMRAKGTELVIEQETELSPDHFAALKDWRIDLLLDSNQDALRAFRDAQVPKVKLSEIAEIFRGKSIMKNDLKPGKIKVLNISNIEDSEVALRQLDTIDEEERKVKRYEIFPGDLVMTCRGTVTKLAVFPQCDSIVIASANIIVIRFKSKVRSHYAKIFLESPTGMALIQSYQRGTTVMNLNPADVGEIELPLRPEAEQDKLIQRYIQEKQRFLTSIQQAAARWEQVKNNVYSEIF